MISEKILNELFFLRRFRFISNDEEPLLRLLAEDPNVNNCGVYVSNVERFAIETEKVSSEIRIIQGRNEQWFFGLGWQVRIGAFSGSGFAPHITQAINGESRNSHLEALEFCVTALKRSLLPKLCNLPEAEKAFNDALEDFCISNLYGITYNLPLFNQFQHI